ncbi:MULTISPECIES: PqqD family peptide modification chaperone [Actinoalloteichus]|uniref:PqqD family peptide modification chaperone n=1 Tax=Actinoalloteichus TaxID=65496 RepID=UPI000378504A|nr:PqqD family peptide modification chaperone [Actinoalloteichus spitiensis]
MLRLRADVHHALTGEGGALLDERTGRWTYLSPSASMALRALLHSDSMEQASRVYADRYGVDPLVARSDLEQVVDAVRGLLHQHRTSVRRRRWWSR